MRLPIIIAAISLMLAGGAGFLVSQALGQQEPSKTVTVDLKNGEPGPPGPRGPQGPPGGTVCPDGYVFGKLVVNHPGGQVTILTCMTTGSN